MPSSACPVSRRSPTGALHWGRMAGQSYLIGIAGPSGAGKSYLASRLAQRLRAPVLALDHYYRDLSHLPWAERARSNFDEPAALEHELLIAQVSQLHKGNPIAVPTYDFALHTRTPQSQLFPPAPVVIIEGLFTLYWPELRRLLGTRVYVEMTDEICLQRRQERDVRERGRTSQAITEQFHATVAPMAARYVRPSQVHAHVVVSGDASVDEEAAHVLNHVRRQLPQGGLPAATEILLGSAADPRPAR